MLKSPQLVAMVGTAQAPNAKAFYGETLGFRLVSEDMFALVFEVGGAPLRVNRVPAVIPSTYAVLSFRVGDIEEAVRALTAKGVVFERYPMFVQDGMGIWTAPDGTKVAWFRDPDANLLGLVQSQEG